MSRKRGCPPAGSSSPLPRQEGLEGGPAGQPASRSADADRAPRFLRARQTPYADPVSPHSASPCPGAAGASQPGGVRTSRLRPMLPGPPRGLRGSCDLMLRGTKVGVQEGAGFWPGGACPRPGAKPGLGHSRPGGARLEAVTGPKAERTWMRKRILWSGSGEREMRRGDGRNGPRADFGATLRAPPQGPAGPLGRGRRWSRGRAGCPSEVKGQWAHRTAHSIRTPAAARPSSFGELQLPPDVQPGRVTH